MSESGRDGKFHCMLRSRSHKVGQETPGLPGPGPTFHTTKRCCWANLLPELLLDVLSRIECSESSWPQRRDVVACAGVCRNWREMMKEIVKNPEISGKLTFPIALKQPGHRTSFIQCYIKRNRSGQTYHLFLSNQALNEDGKFLLAARRCRRPTYTDYIIYVSPNDASKGNTSCIGKLRSNFIGTKFTIFDAHSPNSGPKLTKCHSTRIVGSRYLSPRISCANHPVAHITYELNVLGSRGPRRMQCIMDSIPASAVEPGGSAPTQTDLITNTDSLPSFRFFRSKSTRAENLRPGNVGSDGDGRLVLRNKSPRWHEQLQCWCLNFNGRVTVASVKNFQLVALNASNGSEQENVLVQFGKVGKDVFTMDYRYPLSAFQAFALCLSSFDTKIACE